MPSPLFFPPDQVPLYQSPLGYLNVPCPSRMPSFQCPAIQQEVSGGGASRFGPSVGVGGRVVFPKQRYVCQEEARR